MSWLTINSSFDPDRRLRTAVDSGLRLTLNESVVNGAWNTHLHRELSSRPDAIVPYLHTHLRQVDCFHPLRVLKLSTLSPRHQRP